MSFAKMNIDGHDMLEMRRAVTGSLLLAPSYCVVRAQSAPASLFSLV
jgi:hypothetical protein